MSKPKKQISSLKTVVPAQKIKQTRVINNWQRMQKRIIARCRSVAISKLFNYVYLVVCLVILFGTTIVWSYFGARLQQTNADQLAYPGLFKNAVTFHSATFASQHSFLLKWPIFYLQSLTHNAHWALLLSTIGLAVITVGSLAFLLWRIDSRPLAFGTLCLLVASTSLLIPAQPFAGNLLPGNLAMVTTLNIEYLVFIAGLVIVAKQPRFNTWCFWLAVGCLTLAIASDKLFLSIDLVAALIAVVVYGLKRRWNFVTMSTNWLIVGLFAAALAIAGLWIIDGAQVTHIVSQPGNTSFITVHTVHQLLIGTAFAAIGVLTNFGANPAYGTTAIANFPTHLWHGLATVSTAAFLVNAVVLIYGIVICSRFIRVSLFGSRNHNIKLNGPFRLANMAIISSIAAFVLFIISSRNYAVDGRYLALCWFSMMIVFGVYMSRRKIVPHIVFGLAAVFCLAMLLSVPRLIDNYHLDNTALNTVAGRDNIISRTMAERHINVLVGNYQRVDVIAHTTPARITNLGLQNCTEPRTIATSQLNSPDLHGHSFAYLLTISGTVTNFPSCSLQTVTHTFGRPDGTDLIAGSLAHPAELLLFYSRGLHKLSVSQPITTILPVSLNQSPDKLCVLPTTMNIVAHEDDDILFINPDIQHEITAGNCVRTLYLTAGDDGGNQTYWLCREQGAEAAYASMLNIQNSWTQRVISLNDHEYVTIANPSSNNRISLMFMHLPDGNLTGQGFSGTNDQSLKKLYDKQIDTIRSIDKQSYYSYSDLTEALTSLMSAYRPSVINTQSYQETIQYPDHSDHEATGLFATEAYEKYIAAQYDGHVALPVHYYIGYAISQLPANVSGTDYMQKANTFLRYALYDPKVCHSFDQCNQQMPYGSWLQREYEFPN